MEAENKQIFPLASLNRQTVMNSGEWGELKWQTVTAIMGSRAQFKLLRTPVNRSGQRFTSLKGPEDGASGKEGGVFLFLLLFFLFLSVTSVITCYPTDGAFSPLRFMFNTVERVTTYKLLGIIISNDLK